MDSKNNSAYASLQELVKHHIESFDYFLDEGLEKAVMAITPVHIKPFLYPPTRNGRLGEPIFPTECRQAKSTYRADFKIDVGFQYDGGIVIREKISFGHVPIMLMSKLCHLRGFAPKKLVHHKEEASEVGGYFICNGLERVSRPLMIQKRNYPMSVVRQSFIGRGYGFSNKAVVIRCVREDLSFGVLTLYYLHNGSPRVGFRIAGREYLLPVGLVLKALIETTDYEISVSLSYCYNEKYRKDKGAVSAPLIRERARTILDDIEFRTRNQCLEHIGILFRPALSKFDAESDTFVGEVVLRDYILVHLNNNHEKFNLLIFMLQKLFALVDQNAAPDNVDALQNMEVLLIGHIMTIYLKEKLEEWLLKVKRQITDEMNKKAKDFEFRNLVLIKKITSYNASGVGRSIENMIRNGRLATLARLDLPQHVLEHILPYAILNLIFILVIKCITFFVLEFFCGVLDFRGCLGRAWKIFEYLELTPPVEIFLFNMAIVEVWGYLKNS
ncbi:hypothetical protein IEQ34_007813 [Dendrobium chrysotoxum]|uniref:DNA-directed RNA polymerase n=1 Tax=Dendrobium chrysotoxum TaxID=161865 RepID=A0AAV7H291_DENCH|nr:hypothetical protein IEQ34_007813 [Dendrobium chrysotoxum]